MLDFVSSWSAGWQWFVGGLVLLSILGLSIPVIIRFLLRVLGVKPMWPSREKWNAHCKPWHEGEPNKGAPELNANLPLHYPGQRWCQMRNMEKGDYYQVDMQKDRLISELHLVCMEGRYPKKYRIEIAKSDAMDSLENLGEYDGPIHHKFKKSRKFRVVKFTIVEPDILEGGGMHSWCIYDVIFTEVRFLRWKVPIGAKS